MLLISQNLSNYMNISDDAVIRINLAWISSLEELKKNISEFQNDIFLDVPIGRLKPPNNSYDLNDIKDVIGKIKKVKYLAISNVESGDDLLQFTKVFGDEKVLVPKIETKKGVKNISEICNSLIGDKLIMLDHDDLFSDLIKNGESPSIFFNYIKELSEFCEKNSVALLKTRGVIFSDQDKYYI